MDEFPKSTRRRLIWTKFLELRTDALASGVEATQWLDGSFLESKVDPNDIDVATLIDYDTYNSCPPAARYFIDRWLRRGKALERYETDGYLALTCAEDHPYAAIAQENLERMRELFAKNREQTKKGFAEIPLARPVAAEEQ